MDFPTVLLRDLLDLSASVQYEDEFGGRLAALISALRTAVPSYRGLSLTVHVQGEPVSLTSFLPLADGDVATSLRLPFTAFAPGFDSRSRVVFYAAKPGAFVDLAADLGHALRARVMPAELGADRAAGLGDGARHSDGQHDERQEGSRGSDGAIVVDADLPPHTLDSRLTGLDEVSTINRAVGMLIDKGHHPDTAHATLRRHAADAGVEPHIYAARMLRR